ncbi:hypothetical protein P5V15_000064 [Pogonomyrmex californicus]
MEIDNSDNDTSDEEDLSFGKKEDIITILNDFFKYGPRDLPLNIFSDISTEDCHSTMDSAIKLAGNAIKNKPTLVNWLHSDLFKKNECNVPLALLLISFYEQHSSSDQENAEFREIYRFLYQVMTNQPIPRLSNGSAKVLYKLLSDVIEEVWPSTQLEILNYLSAVHIYSRSAVRRTY